MRAGVKDSARMRAESQTAKQPECARNRKQDSTENVGRISIKDPAGMWSESQTGKHLIGEIPPNVRVELGRFPRNESGSGNVMMND